MLKEWIFTLTESSEDDYDRICDIAIQAGGDEKYLGTISYLNGYIEVFVPSAKQAGAVKIWSALRNNGYLMTWIRSGGC